MTVFGADADELDRLAAAFRKAADELDSEGGAMTQLLNNVSWLGDVAGSFIGGWSGIQVPRIGLSTRFLREAADDLSRNSAEQRRHSDRSTGTIGSITVRPGRDGNWEFLEEALEGIGLSRDAIEKIISGLKDVIGADQLKDLLGNLFTPGLLTALKGLNAALDIVDFIVDLGKDFADHAHLEMQDRIRHAVIDASISFGLAKGADAAVTAAMTVLGSLIPLPGAGTALGIMVGKVIGFVVGEAVEYGIDKVDDHFDIKDTIADKGVDMLKLGDQLQGEVIETVIDVGVELIEAGTDIVDGITDWIF